MSLSLSLSLSRVAGAQGVDPRPLPAPPPPQGAPPGGAAPQQGAPAPGWGPAPPPQGPAQPAEPEVATPRPTGELWLGLGIGGAACDDEKPDNDCPVSGATTFALGGGWRFSPHWSIGAELAVWSYSVRGSWKGQLEDPATDVSVSSDYIALMARWYWLSHGVFDGYLTAGLGGGTLSAHAENGGGKYDGKATGLVYPLGIGAEFFVSNHFRIGGQALAYLLKSSEFCEESSATSEVCKDATNDQNALPWRIAVFGTYAFGSR